MKKIILLFLITTNLTAQNLGERYALIIGGAGGEKVFTDKYYEQTTRMYDLLVGIHQFKEDNVIYLFEDLTYDSLRINGISNAEEIRKAFRQFNKEMKADDLLLVFLTGHGTFDGKWAKFNIVGPDLKDIDYARLIAKLPTKKVVFINASSASGPFIDKLSNEGRIIITATKSGRQHFETNFADFFLNALEDDAADLNKDNRVSFKEAFVFARTSQDKWFEDNRRLRAEHPLIDDNGDGIGSQHFEESKDGLLAGRVYLNPVSSEYQRAVQKASSGNATELDKLTLEKVQLEEQIVNLKARKASLTEEDYNEQMRPLLIKFAQTNAKIREHTKQNSEGGDARSIVANQQLSPALQVKYLRARTAFRDGKYEEVIRICEEIRQEQPSNKVILDLIDKAREKL